MKKIFLMLAVIIGSAAMAVASDVIGHNALSLPAAAQTELKRNFKAEVSLVKADKTIGRITEYEAILTDGTEVTFDRSGNWKEVEVRRNGEVPSAYVPAEIKSYVKQYQKGAKVIGIEKTRSGYDVELSNGVDMKFAKDGKFKGYDD